MDHLIERHGHLRHQVKRICQRGTTRLNQARGREWKRVDTRLLRIPIYFPCIGCEGASLGQYIMVGGYKYLSPLLIFFIKRREGCDPWPSPHGEVTSLVVHLMVLPTPLMAFFGACLEFSPCSHRWCSSCLSTLWRCFSMLWFI